MELEGELGASLHSYCDFLFRARQHAAMGKENEGFLHFVIALELLLSDRYAIGASVTRRAAVLTQSGESEPFEARLRSITRLYERRSRFVHQGEPVPVDALTEATTLCEEVAYCLLQLAKAGSAAEWSAEKWQKELDFVASAWEAGKEVQPTDLERLGLELAP